MSSKLQLAYVPVATGLDIIIRDPDGLVWNNDTELYETWADANLADYVVPATYIQGNMYLIQWPLVMESSVEYLFIVTQRAVAGAPSLTDFFLSGGNSGWDKDEQTLTIAGVGGGGILNIVHDTTQIVNAQTG